MSFINKPAQPTNVAAILETETKNFCHGIFANVSRDLNVAKTSTKKQHFIKT